jgi:hypothetical protein
MKLIVNLTIIGRASYHNNNNVIKVSVLFIVSTGKLEDRGLLSGSE